MQIIGNSLLGIAALILLSCSNYSQKKENIMETKNPLEIVNKYLNIIFVENKNGEGLTDMLTEDFSFDDPFSKSSSAKAFITNSQPWIKTKKTLRMQKQFVDSNLVCSIYTIDVLTLSGKTESFDLADYIELRNGKIAKEKVYFFDQVKFTKAMGFMEEYLKQY